MLSFALLLCLDGSQTADDRINIKWKCIFFCKRQQIALGYSFKEKKKATLKANLYVANSPLKCNCIEIPGAEVRKLNLHSKQGAILWVVDKTTVEEQSSGLLPWLSHLSSRTGVVFSLSRDAWTLSQPLSLPVSIQVTMLASEEGAKKNHVQCFERIKPTLSGCWVAVTK